MPSEIKNRFLRNGDLTGANCYRCNVALTYEYGMSVSDTARWYSYAAESRECCKKCCREMEDRPVLSALDIVNASEEMERARR